MSRTVKNWISTWNFRKNSEILNLLFQKSVFWAKNKSAQWVKGIISRKYIGVQRLVSKLGLVEALHGHLTEIFELKKEVFRLRKGRDNGRDEVGSFST